MINPQNILRHELVGLRISAEGPHSSLGNISGQIIYETRGTVVVRTDSGVLTLPKNSLKRIEILGDGGCFIKGVSLIGRPEDRVSRSD